MGFFRKWFRGEDEGAIADATPPAVADDKTREAPESPPGHDALADPYRGAVLVEEPIEEPVEITKGAKAIWHYRSRVLCIELGMRLPVRSMVYTGRTGRSRDLVRRVTFGDGGFRLDWEHETFEGAIEGWMVRVEDRIVMPRHGGVVAIHVVTGELCWEIPHRSRLAKKPLLDSAGGVLLVFEDQRWMVVAPRDGATRREGTAISDRDVEQLSEGCTEIGHYLRSSIEYGGSRVSGEDATLEVGGGYRAKDGDPRSPKIGTYPLEDGWEPKEWIGLAGGKLVVRLKRQFGNLSMAAVALFDPTSLEPLQLLELCRDTGSGDGWVVDDVVLVDLDLKDHGQESDVMFVVDPHAERVIAMFDEEGRDAFLFDRDGARVWKTPL